MKRTKISLNKKLTLDGFSRGSYKTGLRIPELKIMFDAGVLFESVPHIIFITHTHIDHVKELPYILPNENKGIVVIAPKTSTYFIENFINSVHQLSLNIHGFVFNKYKLIGVEPNNIYDIKIKSCKLRIKTFNMTHDFPCLGYAVYELRKKLKDEYKQLEGVEIGKLRKQGIQVTELKEFPIIFFSGDTDKEVLHTLPFNEFKHFIIECTFLLDEDIKCVETKKHLHYKNLLPYFKQHQDTTFILIHFSLKYTTEILDDFKNKNSLNNVVFFY